MTLFQAITHRRDVPKHMFDTIAIATAVTLLILTAKTSVPFYPVPMTLQTLAVIGIGLALGPVRGVAALVVYLGLGAAGYPVFSGTPEKGIGLAYMAGPTGGYMAGYFPAILISGWAALRGWDRNVLATLATALLAGAVLYIPGLLWLGVLIGFDKPVLEYGLYPFILGDVVKAALAALAVPAVWRLLSLKGDA